MIHIWALLAPLWVTNGKIMIWLSKFQIFSIPFFEPSAQKNGHFWGFLIKMMGLGTWIFNFQSSKIGVTLVIFKKIDFLMKSVILSWFSKLSIFFNFFGKKIEVQNSKIYTWKFPILVYEMYFFPNLVPRRFFSMNFHIWTKNSIFFLQIFLFKIIIFIQLL